MIKSGSYDRILKWSDDRGYRLLSCEILTYASNGRYSNTPGLARIRIKRLVNDEEMSGSLHWTAGFLELKEFSFSPDMRTLAAQRAAATIGVDTAEMALPLAGEDQDLRVLSEVNRRLDAITSQPGWVTEYDLDGSGHVDEEEWSILRGNVLEQVKAELGQPGVHAVMTPDQGTPAVSPAAKAVAPQSAAAAVGPTPAPAPSPAAVDALAALAAKRVDESDDDVVW